MLTRHIHQKKLKPIPENGKLWDGYRGNRRVIWSSHEGKKTEGHLVEVFAAGCRWCNQWWGWTIHYPVAARIAKAMSRRGCPRCKKNLSEKRYKKVQKLIRKKLDS